MMFIADRIDQNALAAKIMGLVEAKGYPAMFEGITNAYDYSVEYLEMMVAATVLSLQRHAKPGEDPLAKLDLNKVPTYAQELLAERAAVKAGAPFSSFNGMRQLLTSYPDKARIRYQKQFSYKGVNYSEHPIEKTYSTAEERKQITNEQHMANAMCQLTEQGIMFHEAEVAAAFEADHYSCSIPVIQFMTRFRSSVSYSRYSGDIQPHNYTERQIQFRANRLTFTRLYDHYTKLITDQLTGHPHITLKTQPAIDLSITDAYHAPGQININVAAVLTTEHLDHHLRPQIHQSHISAYAAITKKDLTDANAGRPSAGFDATIETLDKEIEKYVKNLAQKAKRRYSKKGSVGDDAMSFDLITQELVAMVARQNPKAAQRIIEGELKFYDILGDQDMAQRVCKAQKARIGFTTVDGKMQASFRLSPQHIWNKNSLRVPAIPDTIAQALVGRPAAEVLEHPIANLLGTVRTVRTTGIFSKISFNSRFEDMTREKMREKIARMAA